MTNNKYLNLNKLEILFLTSVYLFLIINALIQKDSLVALISAICGITYTFIAGKGNPICYLFGVTGSAFYCILSFQNALWGNLLLYAMYYIPMQVLGYLHWNKNLKEGKSEIVKTFLSAKELFNLLLVIFILTIIVYFILLYFKDAHPLLDSITTVFSLGGMYLTVKRAIEQWQFWMIVNALSVAMWLFVVLNGAKAYSTVTMWTVYLFLAAYFYFQWKKEIYKC